MNYLTTRDFDIRQQEILRPYQPKVLRPMNQRFCDPIIQWFLIKGGLRPLHAVICDIIDIQK